MGSQKRKTLFSSLTLALVVSLGGMFTAASADDIAEGKQLAFDRKLGNCLACHMMGDGVSPGNIGPPLIAMKARFPDINVLRAQIYDATVKNPKTIMPPFGKHQMLSADQLDKVVAYVYTL